MDANKIGAFRRKRSDCDWSCYRNTVVNKKVQIKNRADTFSYLPVY